MEIEEHLASTCRALHKSPTSTSSVEIDLPSLVHSALKDCSAASSDGRDVELTHSIDNLHGVLGILINAYHSSLPNVAEVLELTLLEIMTELLGCSKISSLIMNDVRCLLSSLVSTSHPRDTLTLLLGEMNNGSAPIQINEACPSFHCPDQTLQDLDLKGPILLCKPCSDFEMRTKTKPPKLCTGVRNLASAKALCMPFQQPCAA